jgi:hypothetical protein
MTAPQLSVLSTRLTHVRVLAMAMLLAACSSANPPGSSGAAGTSGSGGKDAATSSGGASGGSDAGSTDNFVAGGSGGADSGGPDSNPATHQIKWNPGNYMASGGVVYPGATIANSNFLGYELSALNNQDGFVGYRMLITWGALEPTEGNYDFSVVTSVLNYLKTQLNEPKHLVLVVLPGSFTSSTAGSREIPQYILSDSTYGPSPVAGSYGWWGGTGNGNTSTACLYRAAVMARWIALHQALGQAFDSEPYFEAIMFQEDSWVMGAWTTNGVPDYPGDATMLTDFEQILTSTLAVFPHTNVIFQNTWMGSPGPTTQLEQFLVQHRIAPSTADTFGQTYVDAHNGELNSWGMNAYIGLDPVYDSATNTVNYSPGTDYRPQIHSMVDIEAPDLGLYQDMGGTIGLGGYAPQDICSALNQSYGASHAFWTYLGDDSSVPTVSQWSNLAATVSACPLVSASYPAVYP